MHFGKLLLAFKPAEGLRILNYKQLKKIIKSGLFSEFPDSFKTEIDLVSVSVNSYIQRLLLAAARVQVSLLKKRVLFTQDQVADFKHYMKIPEIVPDDLFAEELVNVFEKSQPDPIEDDCTEVDAFVQEFNEFCDFLEISSCGFRKIVKKFTKRSNGMPVPSHSDFFDKNSFRSLKTFSDSMSLFGSIKTVEIGAELSRIL